MASQKLLAKVSGKVRRFSGQGRKLGFPTANINAKTKLTDGIYFGYADLGIYKNHPSLIFIGKPKTLGDNKHRLEAHLLDIIDQDYYDQELSVKIYYHWRGNELFNSVDQLIKAMQADVAAARKWFKKQGNNV